MNGKHRYRWHWSDRIIREWQAAGFRDFHIYLQCKNKWTSSKTLPAIGHSSFPPKTEYMDDYAAYIRDMVERYNCDGKNDMPGLLYPVRYWEIEAEWETFWKGTVDEYYEHLRVAHRAAKEADQNAIIILQGYIIWGIFEGESDDAEIHRRTSRPIFGKERHAVLDGITQTLRHPELYDVIEFHSLSDYTEIPAFARHLKGEMQKLGIKKSIWVGDANYSLNPMIFWNQPNYPYTEAQLPDIRKWITALKDEKNPNHNKALRWFRAEQACFTAKKIVCAMGEGLAGINIGNLEDWDIFIFTIVPNITGTTAFCGLIDRVPLKQFDETRIPLEPRPVFWTIKLLVNTLGSYMGYTRLSVGPAIYAYRFTKPCRAGVPPSTIVTRHEDSKGHFPDEPLPTTRVNIPASARRILRADVITHIGRKDATE